MTTLPLQVMPDMGNTVRAKRPGSKKRSKRPKIHRKQIIAPENLPSGPRLLGYQDYLVQDIVIEPCNTQYRLARYHTPEGRHLTGQLPQHLQGTHFGTTLQCYILYAYPHQRVTQPLVLQQLHEWDIDISSGQVNRIITENKAAFHAEKTDWLSAGMAHNPYLQVDDPGARHAGKNGYCTHIGNQAFAYCQSTACKSRINFLTLLRDSNSDYIINPHAIAYMKKQGLPTEPLTALSQDITSFANDVAWRTQLKILGIIRPRHIQIATEGALIGSLIHHGWPENLIILSDDAGQFNVFDHALCWIHAERVGSSPV